MEPFLHSPSTNGRIYILNKNKPSMEGAKLCKKEREYKISIRFFHVEPFSPSVLPTMEGDMLKKNTPFMEGAK